MPRSTLGIWAAPPLSRCPFVIRTVVKLDFFTAKFHKGLIKKVNGYNAARAYVSTTLSQASYFRKTNA
jgi:hypothetical protein